MHKVKNILQIILLVSVLTALGAAGTVCALWADWYIAAPTIVAVWAGLAWFGIGVYEHADADNIRPSQLRMNNPPPPPKERRK